MVANRATGLGEVVLARDQTDGLVSVQNGQMIKRGLLSEDAIDVLTPFLFLANRRATDREWSDRLVEVALAVVELAGNPSQLEPRLLGHP